jgi:hypothetical protein
MRAARCGSPDKVAPRGAGTETVTHDSVSMRLDSMMGRNSRLVSGARASFSGSRTDGDRDVGAAASPEAANAVAHRPPATSPRVNPRNQPETSPNNDLPVYTTSECTLRGGRAKHPNGRFVARRMSPAVCRPPFVASRSSPAPRRPPFVARRSSPALRRPPVVARRSPL